MAGKAVRSLKQDLWDEDSCTIRIPGKEIDEVVDFSWVSRGIVSEDVGNQDNCSSCWAWVVAEASEAAMKIARRDAVRLSAQDIINNTYLGRRGCCGGQAVVALQWIVDTGVAKHSDCPYTGIKLDEPKPLTEKRYFIDSWKAIKDDESGMIEALENQPVIVSIPYVHAVLNYDDGLLDLNRADTLHNSSVKLNADHPDEEHTVLLVGRGHVISDKWPKFKIQFWIIKNQWTESWGKDGFAHIIFTSSLVKLKKKLRLHTKDSEWFYSPLVPVVRSSEDEGIHHVDKVHTNFTPRQLKNRVAKNPDVLIIVLLYHRTGYIGDLSRLFEELRLVSAMYEHHKKVIVAKIDIVKHPNAAEIFSLGVRESHRPVLLSFPSKEDGETRSLQDALEFPADDELKFAQIVNWLENATELPLSSEEDY